MGIDLLAFSGNIPPNGISMNNGMCWKCFGSRAGLVPCGGRKRSLRPRFNSARGMQRREYNDEANADYDVIEYYV